MIAIVSVALILMGAVIALLDSLGLARFPDVFTRLHGPTKATTLGVGGVLLGVIILFLSEGEVGVVRELLITVFLFLTAPVSAHLVAKAALHRKCETLCPRPDEESAR